MLNWLRKKKEDNKGFTLVELIIVVAILAILVGLLVPQYMKYVEKSRQSTDVSNLERFVEAVKVASADVDYNLPAATYTIEINGSATTIDATGASGSNSSTAKTTLEKALKEFAGDSFAKTELKSTRWTGDKISATIVIKDDSSVTVTYSPTEVKDLTK